MKKSGLIFQCIALVTLVLAFIIFWISDNGTIYVSNALSENKVATNTFSELQAYLYRMIPIVASSIVFSISVAFLLEEWVPETNWFYRIITQLINILANIPSLFYGLFGIYIIYFITEKVTAYNITVSFLLLIIPYSIQLTQQVIRNVDLSVREAAYALGAKKLQVVIDHVFPQTFSNMVAGVCITISRTLSFTSFILLVYVWRNVYQNDVKMSLFPSSVIILLIMALLCSVLSSAFQAKKDIN